MTRNPKTWPPIVWVKKKLDGWVVEVGWQSQSEHVAGPFITGGSLRRAMVTGGFTQYRRSHIPTGSWIKGE
jgi:hypothetical protein